MVHVKRATVLVLLKNYTGHYGKLSADLSVANKTHVLFYLLTTQAACCKQNVGFVW